MGHTEFLVGSGAPPTDLLGAIADLEDKSMLFVSRWARRDHRRAGDISRDAMILLDFIASELLRQKVERMGQGRYAGDPFETAMRATCGSGVTGVSIADQVALVEAGPGAGSIATQLGIAAPLTLDRLLNKIKHRNPRLANFRIELDRHIFVICPERTGGGAEGIYEFDVGDFCDRCRAAAATL